MTVKRKIAGSTLVALTSLLMACGNAETDGTAASSSQKNSTEQTISLMAVQEIGSMNSLLSQDSDGFTAQSQVFEGLYRLDKEDNVVPALAVDMPDISEDGLTYTIKMREDSKWSNGTKVTAHDFVYAWKKLADPDTAANYAFLLDGTILNGSEITLGKKSVDELGVKAVDDYTLEVKLQNPTTYFLSLLAFNPFYPQNEEYVESEGDAYASTSDHMIYNGPFTMTDWSNAGSSWTLVKNKDYWDAENVKADEIDFQVIKETGTALNLYDAGELDQAVISGEYVNQRKNDPEYLSTPNAYVSYFRMNQLRNGSDTIFANENVRKAVGYAVDKEALVNNVLQDGSVATYGFVPHGFVKNPETEEDFREEAGDFLVTDKDQALSYWKEAQKEIGETIKIELLTSDGEADKKVAEYLQSQLQDTLPGLNLTIRAVPLQNSIQLTRNSDYDLAFGRWGPDYQDPMTFLANHLSGGNANYSNPEYDALLEEASTDLANEPEARWEALIKAETILIEEDAGIVPVYQQSTTVLQKDNLKGIVQHNFGSPYDYKGAYKE